jgi:glycosyltransferase involved in cell wall biosynthesis
MSGKKSNPTIAFDTWVLGSQARNHGIHVYAKNLLGHFRDLAPRYAVEITPYVCVAADNDANQLASAPGFQPKQTRLLKHSRVWRWGGANLVASLEKADLVFSPNCTTLYVRSFVPSVVTIHDLTPMLVRWGPKRVAATLQFLLRWAAKSSRAVITVSQRSKDDLVDFCNVPDAKISVVYSGYDKANFNSIPPDRTLHRGLLQRFGVSRPYVVHHGVIKPNKNLRRLVQAYRLVLERNPNLEVELVLAGPLGWEYDDVLAEASRGTASRGKVIFTRALSDPELAMLVKGASLAVIPSLYEGFCLPLVESMACGVPTIAANSSCLPEISGGVLRYFDPESTDEMAFCMEEALENEDLRQQLSEKGLRRALQFDWRRCADETLTILARVAEADGQ